MQGFLIYCGLIIGALIIRSGPQSVANAAPGEAK